MVSSEPREGFAQDDGERDRLQAMARDRREDGEEADKAGCGQLYAGREPWSCSCLDARSAAAGRLAGFGSRSSLGFRPGFVSAVEFPSSVPNRPQVFS